MHRLLILVCLLCLPFSGWAAVRDLPQIRESGVLRVLVNQSRHSSAQIGKEALGVELQRLHALELFLNAQPGRHIRLQLKPLPKNQLMDALRRGEGDLVAPGELMAEPGEGIAASRPIGAAVPLVVVARQGNRRYARLDDLSGRVFALPVGSAAAPALKELSASLRQRDRAPVDYETLDASLAVEDVLEMIDSGALLLSVVEEPIARRWAAIYPRLRIDSHMPLVRDGQLAWYVRDEAGELRQSIDAFLASPAARASGGDLRSLYKQRYRLQNPLGRLERQRLAQVRSTLQKQAKAHDLEWLFLAAIAFKESTLNPRARGVGGAGGLMQISPASAHTVGVNQSHLLENNVLAASRYLARLRREYYASPAINERERRAFLLAAYNLGPQRVQALREEARRRGLDANRWFFSVERIALEDRMSVAVYVAAVNKYYLTYERERDYLER